jgi:hypothetical protein
MNRRMLRILAVLALALALAGCYDVEAEIKLLADGSGFVTLWVRVPTRLAAIGSALQGSTLAAEKQAVLARLDQVFDAVNGVRLVERVIVVEGDAQILRYRYAFDTVADLNHFWADPENTRQDDTISGARLTFAHHGEGCDATFQAEALFPAKSESQINEIGTAVFGRQAADVRTQLAEEYYKGRFRLRLALPGQASAADAEQADVAGFPIWQRRLIDLYRRGLAAKAASHMVCDEKGARKPAPDETYPTPSIALSEGPKPVIGDVLAALYGLGDLVTMEIEADVGKLTSLRITYHIDERVDQPVANLLFLVLGTTPTLAADWDIAAAREESGQLAFTVKTKRPLRLDKTGSAIFFAGPDGDQTTFRLRLPPLASAASLPPEAAGPVMVRVKVKMPKAIRQSNAMLTRDDTARWMLTARDLTQPVVLEAFCPK